MTNRPAPTALVAEERRVMRRRIMALPPGEHLRLAADFFDEGRTRWALTITKLAAARIALDLAEEEAVREPE